jgi:VCBS repeat-containing protein
MMRQNPQSGQQGPGAASGSNQGSDATSQFNSQPGDNSALLPLVGDLGVIFQPPSAAQSGSGALSTPSSTPGTSGNTSPFVINVTYDQSLSSLPSGFVAAINYVVSYYESIFTSPITVNIDVGYGEIDGQALSSGALGESEAYLSSYNYSTIKSALATVDPGAANSLPSSAPGNAMWIGTAEAKALGLPLQQPSTDIDGYAGFSSVYPFTYNPNDRAVSGEYDFIGVVEHEFTEVMGRIDLFGQTIGDTQNSYSLLDMFHYTAPSTHTYTGLTTNYFSADGGVTNLDNFNTNPNGDLGDWAASAGDDAYLAFSPTDEADTVSQSDIAEMNALGYGVSYVSGIVVTATTSEALQGGGSAVALLSGAPVITDPASSTLSSATIKIANGSGNAVAGDQLFVAGQQSGTVDGVTVSWTAATATLTLSGSASLATYQTLLSEVTYLDTGTDTSSGSHPKRTVTWSVSDGTNSYSTTSQVTIDRAPVAGNATGFEVVGTTLAVPAASGVLSGDSDLDGDALAVSAVNGVAGNVGVSVAGTYGHLTLDANGSYSYVANNGVAAGSVDSFTYTASDGNGGTATATLRITLDNALQTLPLAVLTPVGQATPSSWMLSGSGGDGGLSFGLASAASHGTAVVNANGTFTYTPTAGYSGTDSFQFKVTDALGETSVNTVSVGVGNSGFQATQSLQLTASQSQYLTQTPAAAGNQETWTWSGWVDPGSGGAVMTLFSTGSGSPEAALELNASNQLEFYDVVPGSYRSLVVTNLTLSANTWSNVVVVYNTPQAAAANRLELFVNGQQVTSLSTQIDPAQNSAGDVNGAVARYLGYQAGGPDYFNGNVADVQFVDGQAVSASAFGQTISGQWTPIAYTGSYGANGYDLPFAASGIGADVSGSGNNWTPVNLSAANVSSLNPGGSGTQVALTLDNGLLVNNGSSDELSGATVKITGGFAGDGDLLSDNTSGTGITASWNAATETLVLSGTDTAAHYSAVLDQVMFSSSASDPTNGGANATRTATWQVTDATNATLSTAQSEIIDVNPAYVTVGSAVQHGYSAIGFDANSMLGYTANAGNTGGLLGVTDSSHTANIALIGNYVASSFVAASDGHGGTLITESPIASQTLIGQPY